MRTLVISDLHLGSRGHHDALRLPVVRERLAAALADTDRLVLLGDTVELMLRQPRRSMAVAEPIVRAIGQALGSEAEAIVVPGNHDAALVRGWALAQGELLRPSHTVPPTASPALERLLSFLAPARVSVSYPGVWLDDRTWATHGHYLDHHLLPRSAVGLLAPRERGAGPGTARPIEYERLHHRGHRSRESFLDRLTSRPVATLVESAAEGIRTVAIPRIPGLMRRSGLAPVTAAILDVQMRRAALPAMERVVRRLGIDADCVVFGHVHRRGPIGDEPWPGPGETSFLNAGSWLYEPLLVDRAAPPHPYWPGGAVMLESGQPPRTIGLADDLGADQLKALVRTRRG
ncbi:MAG: metallophosphoesterase [Solirubrobacteraceae bacterium]